MSASDQRNTMIVELNNATNTPVYRLQAKNNAELIALARQPVSHALSVGDLLVEKGWRTAPQVLRMSASDQRNTMIVELKNATNTPVYRLQAKNNAELIALARRPVSHALSVGDLLVEKGWRTADWARTNTTSGHRNTLIVKLHNLTQTPISTLQGKNNAALIAMANPL
jgi:uncharacterized protein YfaA (DUF2138 family)